MNSRGWNPDNRKRWLRRGWCCKGRSTDGMPRGKVSLSALTSRSDTWILGAALHCTLSLSVICHVVRGRNLCRNWFAVSLQLRLLTANIVLSVSELPTKTELVPRLDALFRITVINTAGGTCFSKRNFSWPCSDCWPTVCRQLTLWRLTTHIWVVPHR